jgi:dihydroorotase
MNRRFFKLPRTIINLHVHGRDLEQAHKTTVWQTMLEAVAAGIKIIGFMPNTEPPITNLQSFAIYTQLMRDAEKFLHRKIRGLLWLGVTDKNLRELKMLIGFNQALGLKIYPKAKSGKTVTTGSIGVSSVSTIIKAMKIARDAGKPIAIHCDHPEIILKEGNTVRAEVEYVKLIIALAKKVPGVRVVICHVSCRESAEIILAAQKEGLQIAIELCPQYLWFDNAGTNWRPGLHPNFYKCFNCLRSPADREYLVGLLSQENELIFVSADHAPHLEKEKLAGAGGIPSLYETVPVILTLAIRHGLSEDQVAKLISFNAANFFNLTISRTLRRVEIEEREDRFAYNKGRVINPWHGSKLFFPIWKK